MYKKHLTHTLCVKRRNFSFSCLSHSHWLIVCTVTTNNSPYIERWGVQFPFSLPCSVFFWILPNRQTPLLGTEIFEGHTKIKDLLACLACSDEWSLRGRQWNVVLMVALPRNKSTIHHENVAAVMGAVNTSVAGPICIDPFPQLVCF